LNRQAITSEEVANFFNSLSKNEDALESDDDDDEINELVKDIEDFDPDTFAADEDEDEKEEESDDESEQIAEDESTENDREELESIVNDQMQDDSDDEEFVKPEGIDDDNEEEQQQEENKDDNRVRLTKQLIASWIAHIKQDHSIKAFKRLLLVIS
jgi:hypothetical protein